jgi:hypothetical protein
MKTLSFLRLIILMAIRQISLRTFARKRVSGSSNQERILIEAQESVSSRAETTS